ncbi:MAG: YaiI/YqxD family protein [Acetanaerobacterium sp.]
MKVLIDADACPVTDIAIALAKERGLDVVLFCDTSHVMEREGAKTVMVEKGADSADFKLVSALSKGDAVVTQDYGLAAMALARGALVVAQSGMLYTDDNMSSLLESRHMVKKRLRAGKRVKGPPKRTAEHDEAFAQAFARLLDDALRAD